jgi:uncharacterized protein YndB with AHSA1/START domain
MTSAATATTLLEFRTELAAPIERVFAALTEGEHLVRWFCDQAESLPAPGGRLTARWTRPESTPEPFEARWVVFQPPSSCAYEGGHSGYPDGYAGRIGFELADRAAAAESDESEPGAVGGGPAETPGAVENAGGGEPSGGGPGAGTILITRHRIPARPDYDAIVAVYREAWPRALTRLVAYLGAAEPRTPAEPTEPEEPEGSATWVPPTG